MKFEFLSKFHVHVYDICKEFDKNSKYWSIVEEFIVAGNKIKNQIKMILENKSENVSIENKEIISIYNELLLTNYKNF